LVLLCLVFEKLIKSRSGLAVVKKWLEMGIKRAFILSRKFDASPSTNPKKHVNNKLFVILYRMNYSPGDLQGLSQDPGIMKSKEEGVISPLAVEAVKAVKAMKAMKAEVVEVVEVVEAKEVTEVMRVKAYLRVGRV
jgi:hypothetical protein